jgi:hypothetical protein
MAEPPLCTLNELRTVYSLVDLLDFNSVLDFQEDLQAKARSEAKRRAQKANGT